MRGLLSLVVAGLADLSLVVEAEDEAEAEAEVEAETVAIADQGVGIDHIRGAESTLLSFLR